MTPATKQIAATQPELQVNDRRPVGQVINGPWGARPEVRLSVHHGFDGLRDIWTALEGEGGCTAFQTYAWLSAWYRHVGKHQGVKPAIIIGHDLERDDKTLFIMPLGLKRGLFSTRLVWLGGCLCDYQGPILAGDFEQHVRRDQFKALWRDIRALLPRHDVVELDRLPEMIGNQANPFLALGQLEAHASNAHMTRLVPTWDEYYGAKRSSGSKKRDKQKRRKLEEFGAVELVSPQTPAEIERTVDALIAQKAATFARMGVANPFERRGMRDFYMDLATNETDLIHVSRLDVGGKIGAANWGVSFGGRYHYVLASYAEQEDFARRGPGMIQLMELMRRATETGHTEFDFTIGDESYKDDWCEVEIRLYDHLEAVSPLGHLTMVPARLYRRAKRFIKQTPILWSAFTRFRSKAGVLPRLGLSRA